MMAHVKQRLVHSGGALSVEEVADYLRISRAGVWRLLQDKRLPKAKIGGRTVIRRVDAEAFLERCVTAD